MLDVEHTRPRDFAQPRSDTNSYTWGSIGEHNIVIASLPAGEYGTASAAGVAITLLSSFPEVRFGLMVGIGAGVPRQDRDVRLGDVVVSRPHGRSGGVVQYDFVKAIQRGQLERMGSLNSPPKVLLNAVSAIQAQHGLEPSRVPGFLTQMVTRFPRMAQSQQGLPGYVHQGSDNDQLFEATYPHSIEGDCSPCDSSQQLPRSPRPSTEPWIHYGVIASGNTLIKDAATRMSLVRQTGEDCICFEMEAAGLMNQFPCLVIRGICDYADSHKNDNWQRYAAAVAAAYAKELLDFIPAQDVSSSVPAIELVNPGESFPSYSPRLYRVVYGVLTLSGVTSNKTGNGSTNNSTGNGNGTSNGISNGANQQLASDIAALTSLASSLAGHVSSLAGHASSLAGHVSSLGGHVNSLVGQVARLETQSGQSQGANGQYEHSQNGVGSSGSAFVPRIGFFRQSDVDAALSRNRHGFISALRVLITPNRFNPWGEYGDALLAFMRRFSLHVPFALRGPEWLWNDLDHGSWIRTRSGSSDPAVIMTSLVGEFFGWCNARSGTNGGDYRHLYLGLASWSVLELARYVGVITE